jgi:PAS domain S-box-containing protein
VGKCNVFKVYYLTLKNFRMGYIKTDLEGKIIEISSTAGVILGLSEKVLVGKDFREFIDPAGNRKALQFIKKFKPIESVLNVKVNNYPPGAKSIDFRVVRNKSEKKAEGNFEIFIADCSERKKMQEELNQCRKDLMQAKELLKEKNIALRELMGQVEIENQKVKESIAFTMEKLLIPVIKRLRNKSKDVDLPAFDLLENNISQIASQFDLKISVFPERLTGKEIEICNMVRSSFSSKEIASMF